MKTEFERTTVGREVDVILIEGGCTTSGVIYGMFEEAEDAMSGYADCAAIGSVGASALTAEQIELAKRNAARLADCG